MADMVHGERLGFEEAMAATLALAEATWLA